MDVALEFLLAGGTMAVSIGTAYGYVKSSLRNKVEWPEHREICHEKSVEIYTKIDEFKKEVNTQTGEILRALGRIEGKLEK